MKSNMKKVVKRILAVVLSISMMMGGGISALAEETAAAVPAVTEASEVPAAAETSEAPEADTPAADTPAAAETSEAAEADTSAADTPAAAETSEAAEADTPAADTPAAAETSEVPMPETPAAPEVPETPTEELPEEEVLEEEPMEEEIVEEEPIVLETTVDGTTITLTGPASSFEEGKTYSIEAAVIEAQEEVAVIEEALEDMAVEQEMEVADYQAFDIRIFAVDENGEKQEVQPLGPVQVTFSGAKVAKAVEDKDIEVSVLHVDTKTENTQNMGAETTADSDVAIETTHFSVYVLVNLECMVESVRATIEHWSNVVTVDGSNNGANAFVMDPKTGTGDGVGYVRNTTKHVQIYAPDTLLIPNQYYSNLEALSKVCNINDSRTKNYRIISVSITQDGSTKTFSLADNGDLIDTANPGRNFEEDPFVIRNNAKIVFNYEQLAEDAAHNAFDVAFYDYDITGGSAGTHRGKAAYYTDNRGINASFTPGNGPIWGIGQQSSGNMSSWATENAGSKLGNYYLNQLPSNNPRVDVLTGIVKNRLTENGDLQFNVRTPSNLFSSTGGSRYFNNYKLGFEQLGDTYTLESVFKNGNTENPVLDNLSVFKNYLNWNNTAYTIYSNNFWPLDSEQGVDPHMGATSRQYYFKSESEPGRAPVGNGVGDDRAEDHNWHFGMVYEYQFEVGEYTGPMEFYFRGDDDFWLFIDGHLMVDIGGIHSAQGQYIDLRQAMYNKGLLRYDARGAEKNAKTHTMKVFYFERGGSGSNCYMQFTLPNVTPVNIPAPKFTSYSINKVWNDNDSAFRPDQAEVQLLVQVGDSTPVPPCDIPEHDHGHRVVLNAANNWSHTWTNLPLSDAHNTPYTYSVREIKDDGTMADDYYTPQVVGNILTNTLTETTKVKAVKVWQDDEMDYFRPNSVIMQLYANGVPYQDAKGRAWTVTLNAANDWTADFRNPGAENADASAYNLPKYDKAGREVVYTARELNAEGAMDVNELLDGKHGSTYKLLSYEVDENPEDTAYAAVITATNELQYGQLKLRKTLSRFNETFGPATFIFRVDYMINDGTKDLFNTSEVISLVFDEAGIQEYLWPEKFVAGTKVRVTEIYSGASYERKSDEEVEVTILADCIVDASADVEIAAAEFVNDYKDGRLNQGTSALNVFSADNDWDGERFTDVKDEQLQAAIERWEKAQSQQEPAIVPPTDGKSEEEETES